ncbi:Hydroxyquinol 1,2-dioxygenase [Fusarium oxysporum f. sp. albedinis]|nr:Hydroxyquinol 1,2-dioxygenase [Fusarium oxysporum f. sp. albedinis]
MLAMSAYLCENKISNQGSTRPLYNMYFQVKQLSFNEFDVVIRGAYPIPRIFKVELPGDVMNLTCRQ